MKNSEEKKQRKRLNLMESAFCLFTMQGVSKTSVEEITRAAGVAKGTFYLYFKNKYDLHQVLMQHNYDKLFQHALSFSGYQNHPCVADRILSIADDILSQLQENQKLLLFFNKNLGGGDLHRIVERSEMKYRPALENIFGADVMDREDTRIEIYTILELINSTCSSVILEDDPVDMDTFRPYLHRSIRAIVYSFQKARTGLNNQEVIFNV